MNKKILVADDDHAIADAIKMILELDGYEVNVTYDGATLLKLPHDVPDLILLDIWMSGQDGKELCKFLKHQDRTMHIPIILISASKDLDISAKNAGANDFIAKPFEMNELLSKVALYINH